MAPVPSTVPGSEIDLAQTAWYDITSVAFGIIPELPPPTEPLPKPYDRLRVGTLNGHVAGELQLATRLTQGVEGSWANGLFGLDVLAGEDDGTTTRLHLVSALDASSRVVYETPDSMGMATLDAAAEIAYFVPIDRATGRDRGLWRVPLAGGEPEVLFEEPIKVGVHDYASQWRMEWAAGDEYLVTQVCRVRMCSTLVNRLRDGANRRDTPTGELIGVTDTEYVIHTGGEDRTALAVGLESGDARVVAEPTGQAAVVGVPGAWYVVEEPSLAEARAYRLDAWSITAGESRTLVEVEPASPTGAQITHRAPAAGAAVPEGWILRWPPEFRYGDIGIPPHVWYRGELINVVTDERLEVPPFVYPDTPSGCEPIAPSELPSGALAGEPIVTSGGHYLWATWGSERDQVVQLVGAWRHGKSEPGVGLAEEPPATIRGQPARVIPMAGVDTNGPWAIAWEEAGCRYEVQLAPGLTQAGAVEFAGRY